MHVLQVVEPGKDGVFRHVEGLCDYLLTRGDVRVSLAYSDVRASDRLPLLVGRIRAAGSEAVNLRVSNVPQPADLLAYFRLLRLCWRERPDIIHAHSSKAGALARLLRFGGVRVPIIYTPNAYFGMGARKTVLAGLFDVAEHLLSRIGYTINVSSDEAEFARTRIGIPSRRQFLIYNAIDTRAFHRPSHEEKARARKQFGLPEHALVLGCVARDSFQKNLQLLYRAAAAIMTRREDVWLLHVGEGDMTALTDELGLAARVIRVSYLSDTTPFFHAIDAFAMSSRYEGLSFAIIEALGSDRPVIITNVPGNREFLTLGLSHVWSAPNEDLPGFTAAIQSWIDDLPAKRPCNHQNIASTLFSYDACYGAIRRTYDRLAAEQKAPGSSPLPATSAKASGGKLVPPAAGFRPAPAAVFAPKPASSASFLLIGGGGFIGRNLAARLRERHPAARIVLADLHPPAAAFLPPGAVFLPCDVRQDIAAQIGPGAYDCIYNLAAVHREPGHAEHEYYDTNILGATQVCAYAALTGCPRVVFASSIAVYGMAETGLTEHACKYPMTAYGITKYIAEGIHEKWQAGGPGRTLRIIRPGVVYGPGDTGNMLRMIRAVKRGYFVFPGNARNKKSFAYIYGLLDAIEFAESQIGRASCRERVL